MRFFALMIDIVAKVRSNTYVTEDVCIILLDIVSPAYYSFKAGQYLFVQASERVLRAYSIASTPQQKGMIEFCIERVPGGVASNYLWNLQPEQKITMKGTFGHFFYKSDPKVDAIVMIGTGTGVAPLKSMIEYALENGEKRPIHLLFGESTVKSFFYLDVLADLQKKFPHFTYDLCVSREEQAGFFSGRVTARLPEIMNRFPNASYYLCGGQAMLTDVRAQLAEAQVPAPQVYFEKFF